MPGEERWRRVGMSGSLRGRRLEEMTQSNASSPRGVGSTLWVPEGAMEIEFPKMKRLRELPGVIGTLRKASNHFDPTQIGSGTAPPR